VWPFIEEGGQEVGACTGASDGGGACLGAWEFLLKGWDVIGNGSIFQEVRPEDKMATNL
jgi:hypothetical protein